MKPGRQPVGVILAAGASSRMGRAKALLPYPQALAPAGGRDAPAEPTLLAACAYKLLAACARVLIVAGSDGKAIQAHHEPLLGAWPVAWLENPNPARGQFSSLQVAVRALVADGETSALVAPVDHPAFSTATAEALAAAPEAFALAKPEFAGKRGHPVLYQLAMLEAIAGAAETTNARDVAREGGYRAWIAPVDDAGILVNLDAPEDYRRWAEASRGGHRDGERATEGEIRDASAAGPARRGLR